MRLRYTGKAKGDLDIAFEWYEDQRRGLGFEFLDCAEAAIETILQMPKLYPKQHALSGVPWCADFLFQFSTPLKKRKLLFTPFLITDKTPPVCRNCITLN